MTWVETSFGSGDLVPRVDIRSALAAMSEEQNSAGCGPPLRTESVAKSKRFEQSGYDPESVSRDTKGFT